MNKFSKAFTILELAVVVTIIVILSGIILYSVSQYVDKGKDSNVYGNLAILIPAGEVYYNAGSSYADASGTDFCSSSAVTNALSQMPVNPNPICSANGGPEGVCCHVEDIYHQQWAACGREFLDTSKAYCVDSTGLKTEIPADSCTDAISSCSQL